MAGRQDGFFAIGRFCGQHMFVFAENTSISFFHVLFQCVTEHVLEHMFPGARAHVRPMNMCWPGSFAERIKQAIEAAGGTSKVGRITGIKRQTLDNYCKGDSEPRATDAGKIADSLGVRLNWLITGEGPMRAGEVESAEKPPTTAEIAPPALDHDFGGEVCAAFLDLYRAERVYLSTAKIMAIALEKYEEIVSAADTLEERRAILKYALAQTLKDLRSGVSATAQGNRSA